jgi:hypothetical protein
MDAAISPDHFVRLVQATGSRPDHAQLRDEIAVRKCPVALELHGG